mmetsp:Transcript_28902/g.66175  ORF Transcript_28902/g.66175 Transcript_28902/m.66175 type:complete len:300 (+) Transcript_28902:1084-1983(+)
MVLSVQLLAPGPHRPCLVPQPHDLLLSVPQVVPGGVQGNAGVLQNFLQALHLPGEFRHFPAGGGGFGRLPFADGQPLLQVGGAGAVGVSFLLRRRQRGGDAPRLRRGPLQQRLCLSVFLGLFLRPGGVPRFAPADPVQVLPRRRQRGEEVLHLRRRCFQSGPDLSVFLGLLLRQHGLEAFAPADLGQVLGCRGRAVLRLFRARRQGVVGGGEVGRSHLQRYLFVRQDPQLAFLLDQLLPQPLELGRRGGGVPGGCWRALALCGGVRFLLGRETSLFLFRCPLLRRFGHVVGGFRRAVVL